MTKKVDPNTKKNFSDTTIVIVVDTLLVANLTSMYTFE